MSSFSGFVNQKIIPKVMKFVNFKAIIALKDGVLFTLPPILIGSIFMLLANFPYQPIADYITAKGWNEPLSQTSNGSFGLIALIACIGIAYVYVKNEGYEPLSAGIISFCMFVITTNSFVVNQDGVKIDNVIPKDFTGGKGMITAIIIGLVVGYVYSWFMRNDIKIKMPAGVPEGVVNSFSALLPAAALFTGAFVIYTFFKYALNTTFIEFIYKVIQTPLQGLTDSPAGVVVMAFLVPFLWFFGVHGAIIVDGIMSSVTISNAAANGEILAAGKALTIANGAHIVTKQFYDNCINMAGSGITIGLVLCMVFLAKSAQSKKLGKLALIPGLCNINEPILFGTPIVMNPMMAIPFMCMPMISGLISYFSIWTGLVPPFTGVLVPWTTPPILSGLLMGGVRTAIMQAVILVISFFVYLPFFKKVDAINVENEKKAAAEAEANQAK